jgi:hypothetical protein
MKPSAGKRTEFSSSTFNPEAHLKLQKDVSLLSNRSQPSSSLFSDLSSLKHELNHFFLSLSSFKLSQQSDFSSLRSDLSLLSSSFPKHIPK